MIAVTGSDRARGTLQVAGRTPARNPLAARASPGGSASAKSPPTAAEQSDVASRVSLKTMALGAVVAIASEHAAGDPDKLRALEGILSGDTQHKRDKVVVMLVNEWGYRHRTVSEIDRTVATSQVKYLRRACL